MDEVYHLPKPIGMVPFKVNIPIRRYPVIDR